MTGPGRAPPVPLAGARALVTGAGGGIGGGVADELRRHGARVAGIDLTAGELAEWVAADLRHPDAAGRAVEACLAQLDGLDIVVNVAGGSGRSQGDGPVENISDAGWDYVMDTNLRSTFHICRAAVPHLGPGSAVVNVTSVLGLVGGAAGLFDTHAYAAAKGAIISLTRAMAVTYAPRGIRVNALAPGLVRTPMSARAQTSPEVLAEAAGRQLLTGPLIDAAQVASAAVFLASPASGAVTGVVLPVDGGWTAA